MSLLTEIIILVVGILACLGLGASAGISIKNKRDERHRVVKENALQVNLESQKIEIKKEQDEIEKISDIDDRIDAAIERFENIRR